MIERFGETVQTKGAGGSGIAMYKGSIYAEINDKIVRYSLSAELASCRQAPRKPIVSRLPLGGDHPMHPFFITSDGSYAIRRWLPRPIPASRKTGSLKFRVKSVHRA